MSNGKKTGRVDLGPYLNRADPCAGYTSLKSVRHSVMQTYIADGVDDARATVS